MVHALIDWLGADSSVVLFGGRAKDRPYPGSTTVTTVNGGVNSLINTLAIGLAPVRFNALHPGIVGDSPFWEDKPLDAVVKRTPTGRLVTMADVVDATVFLLENRSVNGISLAVDGGWMLMRPPVRCRCQRTGRHVRGATSMVISSTLLRLCVAVSLFIPSARMGVR